MAQDSTARTCLDRGIDVSDGTNGGVWCNNVQVLNAKGQDINPTFRQSAPVAEADANGSITAAEMINGIVVHTVSTGRTLTTPTGAAISAGCPAALAVGDAFYLRVITVGTGADDISTLTAGDGNVTFVGNVTVGPDSATNNGYGTWIFRNTGTSTWVGYRVG